MSATRTAAVRVVTSLGAAAMAEPGGREPRIEAVLRGRGLQDALVLGRERRNTTNVGGYVMSVDLEVAR